MIVAARAADGQAEKYGAGGIDPIDQGLDAVDVLHLVEHVAIGADGVEASAAHGRRVIGIEFVAGDLLFHEAIVGLVVIEGIDDVVAIAPGIKKIGVLLEASGVAVACEIEPVAAPLLTVSRGGEELVDQLFVGIGSGIGHEFFHLCGGGRQSVQIKIGAPDQGTAIGFLGGLQLLIGKFGGDEGVNGSADPGVLRGWYLRSRGWAE